MCSHTDCRVEVLPDGQVDEEHVFTDGQMKALQEAINRTLWRMYLSSTTHTYVGRL